MSNIDLYSYALSIGLQPSDLAAEGITPGSQTITLPGVLPGAITAPTLEPTTGVGGLTSTQLSARAIIQATLRNAGLDTPELIQWANDSIAAGATADQLNLELYDPSSTPGKVVNQLYPEIQQRRANGHSPISIGEVVSYRNTATQVMRAAGLPPSFYDQPEDFSKFIANDVGLPELQSRVQDAYLAGAQLPDDVKTQLRDLYGVDSGHLAAIALDPNRALPAILRQFDSAQIAAAGVRTGFGQIDTTTAEQLAARGVTADQAQTGFNQLGRLGELTQVLPGEGGDAVSQAQQIAAQFGGNVVEQQRIEQRRAERRAAFAGGGGLAATSRGIAGLGTTDGP